MEVKLNQREILELLGQSLGYSIDEKDVTIKSKPFSITITNIAGVPKAPKTAAKKQEESPPSEPVEVPVFTLEDLLMANTDLISKKKPDCPPVRRPLGPLESDDPPPFDPKEIKRE